MKTITFGDDLLGVEDLAMSLYGRIPKLWREIFPSWFTVVVNPSTTFRSFESLQPTLRGVNFDAREISEWAERSEDWHSVHVLLQQPDEKRVCWNLWLRHSDDREYLAHAFLSTAAAILWCVNSHLRAQWRMGLVGKRIQQVEITDKNADTFFCEAFADRVIEPRRFFYRTSPASQAFALIEKKLEMGGLLLDIDPEWLDVDGFRKALATA
ncbi:MAG: hypothetical protein WCO79_01260 [bacterium]